MLWAISPKRWKASRWSVERAAAVVDVTLKFTVCTLNMLPVFVLCFRFLFVQRFSPEARSALKNSLSSFISWTLFFFHFTFMQEQCWEHTHTHTHTHTHKARETDWEMWRMNSQQCFRIIYWVKLQTAVQRNIHRDQLGSECAFTFSVCAWKTLSGNYLNVKCWNILSCKSSYLDKKLNID